MKSLLVVVCAVATFAAGGAVALNNSEHSALASRSLDAVVQALGWRFQ